MLAVSQACIQNTTMMRRSFLKPFITGCNSLLGKQMRKTIQRLRLTRAEPRRVTFVQSKRMRICFSENGFLISLKVKNDTMMCVVLFEHICFYLTFYWCYLSLLRMRIFHMLKKNTSLLFSFQASAGIAYANAKHAITLPLK